MSWLELETLMTDGIAPQGRNIHIYTGQSGYQMISHAYAVNNAIGFVEWMEERKKIDSDTAKNLKSMLTSPDTENFNLAILAIEQLKK